LKDFVIHIVGLSTSKPTKFEYKFGDEFFKDYETGFVSGSHFTTTVVINKHETFLEADFSIQGTVRLVCDRSLEEFDESVSLEKEMVFKYGDEQTELTDEIVVIPRDIATLDLGQYVYEFIVLSLPMKRLHPKFRSEEKDDDDSEGKMVYTSGADESDDDDDEEVDPRWEKLKKLK